MKILIAAAALALTGIAYGEAPVADATSNTTVTFKNPQKFTDAGDNGFSSPASPRVLADFKAYLEKLGTKYLAPGQTLSIEISDIDLAGHFEPLRGRENEWVRVARDGDWPRMTLHYTLRAQGHVLSDADARLSDMNYLHENSPGSESLGREKHMLDEWFTTTFAHKR